jgi:hypothetical protein
MRATSRALLAMFAHCAMSMLLTQSANAQQFHSCLNRVLGSRGGGIRRTSDVAAQPVVRRLAQGLDRTDGSLPFPHGRAHGKPETLFGMAIFRPVHPGSTETMRA